MSDIKVKQSNKETIKTLDKKAINMQKFKNNIISTKERTEGIYQDEYNSGTEYATDKVMKQIYNAPKSLYKINRNGINNVKETRRNVNKMRKTIRKTEHIRKIKKRARNINNIRKKTTKTAKKTIKTAKRTVKTAKKTAKATIKASKMAIKVTKATVKATIKTIQLTIKAIVAIIKAIITATEALIAAIAAGGWIAVLIIIIICLVAMLCGSIYGIFFSSENSGYESRDMSSVIQEINTEFMSKITEIQNNTPHDEYEITSNRAEWKDVLAIYCAKLSNGKDDVELMTLSDDRVKVLKDIFWLMNNISSSTEKVTKKDTEIDESDNKEETILHITITSKSVEEMMQLYNFNESQKAQVIELLKDEYSSMWLSAIYGTTSGNNDIVKVALEQVGNVGGQTYWNWYGFSSRVEWCACFVSWVANQCGYIESGTIPKFSVCDSEGVAWFKACGLWKNKGYSPNARRYNIF